MFRNCSENVTKNFRERKKMQQNINQLFEENDEEKSEIKYPEIVVNLGDLSGPNGNAFVVLGSVRKALKKAGVNQGEIDAWFKEAVSGNYENLLQVCKSWVTIKSY